MSELDEKLFDEMVKSTTEKIPGLGYVTAVLGGMLGTLTIVPKESSEWRGILFSLATMAVSIGFYRAGSVLDDWLFDPIFAPADEGFNSFQRWVWRLTRGIRDQASALKTGRENAAKALNLPIRGIYAESAIMFKRTESWEKHVKLPLELSKAARAFVLPLLALTVYELAGSPWGSFSGNSTPEFLSTPLLPLILLVTVTHWYLQLRILHMEELYELAGKAQEHRGSDAKVRVFLMAEIRETEKRVTYRFYFSREDRGQ